ncbi:MAG: helix-turn-helix transcriptional regulator [Halobacteriales archaeon]
MGRETGVAAAAALFVLLVVGPAAGAGGFAQTGQVDPDTVLLEADVAADGDAAWSVTYRVALDDANATAAFGSLAEEIESNRSAVRGRFRDRMAATVRAAENATGREMAVRNVSVRAERQTLGTEYGVVTYRFEWVGFAAVEGDRLVVGDAIGGLYLDGETSLRVEWPDAYRVASIAPPADERAPGSAVWRGPLSFDGDEPRIALTTAPTTAGPPGGDGGTSDEGLPPVALALIVGAVLAGLGVAGWLYAQGNRGPTPGPAETAETGAGEDGTDEEGPPEELLSNEERVLRLLEEEGGRMKQQAVADRLDWTDAKTSQVVGDLREDDEIQVFRLGRENVLALPDEEI